MNNRDPDCDVAILGAGPAGCAAAIALAQAGAKTIVLEASPHVRAAPGETLHPGIEALLKRLGVWEEIEQAGFARHEGVWRCDGPSAAFVRYGEDYDGPWRGFLAPRGAFDFILRKRAVDLGVEIRTSSKTTLVTIDDGYRISVNGNLLRCRWIIDAAGHSHMLARLLGVAIERLSMPRLAFWQTTTDPFAEERPATMQTCPSLHRDSDGWRWLAPLGDGQMSMTKVLSSTTKADLAGLTPSTLARDVTWRIASRTAGEGWVLAGDAACVVDPLSGKGVLRALWSGIAAANLVLGVLKDKHRSARKTLEYDAWLRSWFLRDVVALRGFREQAAETSSVSALASR